MGTGRCGTVSVPLSCTVGLCVNWSRGSLAHGHTSSHLFVPTCLTRTSFPGIPSPRIQRFRDANPHVRQISLFYDVGDEEADGRPPFHLSGYACRNVGYRKLSGVQSYPGIYHVPEVGACYFACLIVLMKHSYVTRTEWPCIPRPPTQHHQHHAAINRHTSLLVLSRLPRHQHRATPIRNRSILRHENPDDIRARAMQSPHLYCTCGGGTV